MGLFAKKLSEEQLQARIEELLDRIDTLEAEREDLRRQHAEALATGADGSKVKARLVELSQDLEDLPASVEMLGEELQHVRADAQAEGLKDYKAKVEKKNGELRAMGTRGYSLLKDILQIIATYNRTIEALKEQGRSLGLDTSMISTPGLVRGIMDTLGQSQLYGSNVLNPEQGVEARLSAQAEEVEDYRRMVDRLVDKKLASLEY